MPRGDSCGGPIPAQIPARTEALGSSVVAQWWWVVPGRQHTSCEIPLEPCLFEALGSACWPCAPACPDRWLESWVVVMAAVVGCGDGCMVESSVTRDQMSR